MVEKQECYPLCYAAPQLGYALVAGPVASIFGELG